MFLGDIAITWERLRTVEFTFFTLADSGAFATSAPKKLNEAFALVRPFSWEVWPPVIGTVIIAGPVLYLIIIIPEWMRENSESLNKTTRIYGRKNSNLKFYDVYIKEITRGYKKRKNFMIPLSNKRRIPTCSNCVWFVINLFLRQS